MNDAERLLHSMGISHARDIDLEAIAYLQGLTVRKAPLSSCEARLVAIGDKGIITVRESSSSERQRFSIGHEIGHWRYHRSRVLMCQESDIGEERDAANQREQVADRFASSLLMPAFLVVPQVQELSRLTLEDAMRIARAFRTSVTASARRMVALDRFPSVLVSYGARRRNWYHAAPQLSGEWVPAFELDARSRALELLVNRGKPNTVIRSNAAMHFSRADASKFDIYEQFWSPREGEVLGLFTVIGGARH